MSCALSLHLVEREVLGYELVEIEELSGSKATIYSVLLDGDDLTLFDHFVEEYGISHKAAIKDLIARLQVIGSVTGAREQFFKHFEGRPGDGVCALCDSDNRERRLFCVRYGNVAIISWWRRSKRRAGLAG